MKTALLAAAASVAVLAATDADAARSVRVEFKSGGDRLVGDLYLPDDYKAGQKLPAVVVTGAWTTVKEQMAGRYASELADRGFAALAFDFRGWGQSEGEPRAYEHPARKTEDVVAAAAFLATRPEVDATRVGGLGVCASAGYMAGAAAQSATIRSVAFVAPWFHHAGIVDAVYGGKDGVGALTAAGRAAEKTYRETGRETLVPAASATDKTAIMAAAPYYTEPQRGLIPEYGNLFNIASWEPWLTYDAVAIAPTLARKPIAIVHSEAAAIPQGARDFYKKVKGPKTALWLDGVTQFDFYDNAAAVKQASDAVAARFTATLK